MRNRIFVLVVLLALCVGAYYLPGRDARPASLPLPASAAHTPMPSARAIPTDDPTDAPTDAATAKPAAASREPVAADNTAGPLGGLVIVVDPGHGGYDQGCESAFGTYEAPLNLDVSLRLREELIRYGAQVVLTREVDVSLVDPKASGNRKKQDMALRRQVIEDAGAHMVISVHMNHSTGRADKGAQVFYREGSLEGQALSRAIQQAFLDIEPDNRRQEAVGDFYMLGIRDASALVECGFLSNRSDEKKLLTQEYRQQVAEAIARGIVAYWNDVQIA